MHDGRGADQLAQIEARRAVVGVRVRIDHATELQAVIGEDRQIALELLLDRVDECRESRLLAGNQVRLAFAPVQFAKQHRGVSSAVGVDDHCAAGMLVVHESLAI